jgi:hypothetical protein
VSSSALRDDVVEEGVRLVEQARREGLVLRLLGGAAVRFHVAEAMPPGLGRSIDDIDLATRATAGRRTGQLLASLGYSPSQHFNAIHGAKRLLFVDTARDRHVDVFVGTFEMCHPLPITERLELEPVTLPLAELLMTKLQIVKINRKDLDDVFALILAHEVGIQDIETINADRIAQVAARDWGLYHTFELNLTRLATDLQGAPLSPPEREVIGERIRVLGDSLRRQPKSVAWRLRSQVGEKIRWYEEPDEVAPRGRPDH